MSMLFSKIQQNFKRDVTDIKGTHNYNALTLIMLKVNCKFR